MTNAAVCVAVRVDPTNGNKEWAGRLGTRCAIARNGLNIDPASLAYCWHEWLNGSGYVDIERVREFPSMFTL